MQARVTHLLADDELVIIADPLFAFGGVGSHLLWVGPIHVPFLDGHILTDLQGNRKQLYI